MWPATISAPSPGNSHRSWYVGGCRRCPNGTSARDLYSNRNGLRGEREEGSRGGNRRRETGKGDGGGREKEREREEEKR